MVKSKEIGEHKEAAPLFCPSPDVNDKADMFIARFRAGLKLEKVNSIREKQRNQEGEELEKELMMMGGIFDDESTPS